MRYHDTEFPDGTEPTVRRIPQGCDQQGRYPEAAELCTSLNEKHFWKPWFGNQMRCIYCKRLWSFSDDEPGVKSPDDQPWPVDELGIPLPEKEPLWVKAAAIVVGVIVVGALAAIIVGTALSAFGPVPPGK